MTAKYYLRKRGLLHSGIIVVKTKTNAKLALKVSYDDSSDFARVLDIWDRRVYLPVGMSLPENAVVIDVGAHIGVFSLFIGSNFPNAIILSYEPNHDNFARLRQNISMSGLTNIKVNNLAVAGKRKTSRLYIHNSNSGGHSLEQSYVLGRSTSDYEVCCVTISDIFETYNLARCHLLKMDCEGAEYEILSSLESSILERIDNVAMEYHKIAYHNVDELRSLQQCHSR